MENRDKLQEIEIKGFKSFDRDGAKIPFGDVTVLIGANGSGKSNIVSFFEMLNFLVTGALQNYIAQHGFATSFLHYGPKLTSRLEGNVKFVEVQRHSTSSYYLVLSHAVNDVLIFNEETIEFHKRGHKKPQTISLNPGSKESELKEIQKNPRKKTEKTIYHLLKQCQVYQFHDTSSAARVRNKCYIQDNKFIYSDGGNLAAYLYRLKTTEDGGKYYERIIQYIRMAMPQFHDFDLRPLPENERYVMLNWYDNTQKELFGPHQLSDGSLRFICMAALFLQPPGMLPSVIVIDEPELGLHPVALGLLSGMVRKASRHCQVVLATQSPALLDEFEPEEVVVVERDEKSHSTKVNPIKDQKQLDEWLKEYTLSELWDKNVLGGKP
jgi:predicted ATPase